MTAGWKSIAITAALAALASGAGTWASAHWMMRQNATPSLHAIEASDGDSPAVRAAVDHFHTAMGELQKATIAHVFEMRSTLTPAQARIFDSRIVDALRQDPG
mgnify:CR=1 FL=1